MRKQAVHCSWIALAAMLMGALGCSSSPASSGGGDSGATGGSTTPSAGADGATTGSGGAGGPGGADGGGGDAGAGGSEGCSTSSSQGGAQACTDRLIGASGGRPGCGNAWAATGSHVRAEGFDSYEGRAVTAVFAPYGAVDLRSMQSTCVRGGAFDLELLHKSGGCILGGGWAVGLGALFIDVDGDSRCDPARDDLFIWSTATSLGCALTTVTPQSPRCVRDANAGTLEAGALLHALCPGASCPATCAGFTCASSGADAGARD
jgi:hypothetical protein